MIKEIKHYIKLNQLSPFGESQSTTIRKSSIYKTSEGKKIHLKVLNYISSNFIFNETKKILNYYSFTDNEITIKKRQDLFLLKDSFNNSEWLKELRQPKETWKPSYSIIVVTEDENTYMKLKKEKIPVELFYSTNQVEDLKFYDIVQVLDCEKYGFQLEKIPQSIFINSINDVYIERYLQNLSSWIHNLKILSNKKEIETINPKLKEKINTLLQLESLMKDNSEKPINREESETKLTEMNKELSKKLSTITLSGTSLMQALGNNKLDSQITNLIEDIIKNSNLPYDIFKISMPIEIDEEELELAITKSGAEINTNQAENIYKKKEEIKQINSNLDEINQAIVLIDYLQGISKVYKNDYKIPKIKKEFSFKDSKNLLIENPHPVSFNLSEEHRCSFLTGANSGGKTTLLEHVIQLISLTQLGFPASGDIEMPLFTDVYYYAKNKGSMNKGAFETLLTQMASMQPGKNTIILADELEAVTEPGIAGHIITKTAEFFIEKNCYMVFATHLGQEIKDNIPKFSRIDGIEAKGLDENFNLVVNHNPVLGKIANSTPELIIQRLANTKEHDYFKFLNVELKNKGMSTS